MGQLTIVGQTMAREGATYVVGAPCTEADTCPVAKLCQNQEQGRKYRVTLVRPAKHDVCKVFEGGAHAVEAEALPVEASLPRSKLKGTMALWEPPECTKRGCPNWEVCFNPAMRAGAKYAVAESKGAMECPMGHNLEHVVVERA